MAAKSRTRVLHTNLADELLGLIGNRQWAVYRQVVFYCQLVWINPFGRRPLWSPLRKRRDKTKAREKVSLFACLSLMIYDNTLLLSLGTPRPFWLTQTSAHFAYLWTVYNRPMFHSWRGVNVCCFTKFWFIRLIGEFDLINYD